MTNKTNNNTMGGRKNTYWLLREPGNSSYVKSVRIRFAYYLAIALALISAAALGACLQVFFIVLGSLDPLSVWQILLCVVLSPFVFFLIGIVCDEILDLIFDAMDKPPLVCARATISAAFSNNDEGRAFKVGQRVHYGLLIGLEVLPLSFGLLNAFGEGTFSAVHLLSGYLFGGIVFALLLATIYIFSHAFILRDEVSQDFMYDLRHAIDERERIQGFGATASSELPPFHSAELDDMVISPNRKLALLWLMLAFMFELVVSILMYYQQLAYNVGIAITVLAFSCFALSVRYAFPRLLGEGFVMLTISYIVLAIFLPSLSSSELITDEAARESSSFFSSTPFLPPNTAISKNFAQADPVQGYPICDLRWGHADITRNNRLSALELLALSDVSYLRSEEKIIRSIEQDFSVLGGLKVEVENVENYETVGRWVTVYFPELKMRVIAIRGTNTNQDLFYNLDTFSTVKIIQAFDTLLPIIGVVPSETLNRFLASIQVRRWFGMQDHHQHIADHVAEVVARSKSEDIMTVVTGHSLGGILAAIVGANHDIPSLAFSPPGQKFNQKRLGVTREALYRSLTVVRPYKDPVPSVDEQVGFTQYINCSKNAATCHLQRQTACELYQSCGDRLGRALNFDCE